MSFLFISINFEYSNVRSCASLDSLIIILKSQETGILFSFFFFYNKKLIYNIFIFYFFAVV